MVRPLKIPGVLEDFPLRGVARDESLLRADEAGHRILGPGPLRVAYELSGGHPAALPFVHGEDGQDGRAGGRGQADGSVAQARGGSEEFLSLG